MTSQHPPSHVNVAAESDRRTAGIAGERGVCAAVVWSSRAVAVALAATLLSPTRAFPQAYLIDSGPGGTSSIGAPSLFAGGSTTCSPQPQCAASFQFLAAQFTLTEAATISSIEAWVKPGTGGSMDVKIRENVNGLPSTTAPPLRSPNSIFSKRYANLPGFGAAQWLTFQQYEAVLAAGTYWVTFEPVHGSGLNYSMPGNAPEPLPKYAFYGNGNPGYLALSPATNPNHRLGIRIAGTNFSGVAFGTATRTAAIGNFFHDCCPFDDDYILEGTRVFAPIGVEGPALTVAYIFNIGAAHVHGRGKLIENGLSAGAYSTTGSASGAGRGVAYRTFMNMSDVPRTFRINANLHGAFFFSGGTARAGIYAFDTGAFSSTLLASPKTPGHFLLDSDDLGDLGNLGHNISPARFFPEPALLTSDLETASFPINVPSSIPMETGFITLQPGGTVTILFDVAVHSQTGGQVDFANTLSPAADFFTDVAGEPVVEIVAVGPSSIPSSPVSSLVVSPATATSPLGTTHTVTATATTAGGTPVVDAIVTFSIASGPNAGFTIPVSTDSNGEASFTHSSGVVGTDSIQATLGALQSNVVSNVWTAGALDHVAISPESASIAVGGSQAYTAEAFDAFSNSLGDVTSTTIFSIVPDGSCTGASCTATTAGPHTVTANHGGETADASLTVVSTGGYTFSGFFAPVDNPPVFNVVKAGSAVPVKFSLNGNQGLDILAAGYPVSQPIACEAGSALDAIEETVAAGASVLTYDAAADRFVYVWKTNKAWANTCRQLIVKLSDGTSHVAQFRFSK